MDFKIKKDHVEKYNQSTGSVTPTYKCVKCNNIVMADEIKSDVKCSVCKCRILIKTRSPGGIEYSAR